MIRVPGRAVVYGEVWFDETPADDTPVDIVVHRQRSAPVPDARSMPFLSLRIDLALDEHRLRRQWHENCRRQITSAETRDRLHHDFITEVDGILERFAAYYDDFAQQKSIWRADRTWLAALARAHKLVFTIARQDEEVLAWHAYLVSGDCTRLEYSVSRFHNVDAKARALAGRANHWLHWQDMRRFKALGLRWYDWGGMFEDESTPERAGINRFKRGFGGELIRRYDCTVPATLRGRLWLPMRDAWRRLGKIRP